jgi:hypothetical protein
MLSRIYIQCFENNRGAEKVEVNYERLSRTGLIRVRFDSLFTDTHDQLKNRKLIVNCQRFVFFFLSTLVGFLFPNFF